MTLHECFAAADELASSGVATRVIDAYSVKPIDRDTVIEACRVTDSRLVVVEDHSPEGGLGSAVLEALADASVPALKVAHLAVSGLPDSGTPAESPRRRRHLVPSHHRRRPGAGRHMMPTNHDSRPYEDTKETR